MEVNDRQLGWGLCDGDTVEVVYRREERVMEIIKNHEEKEAFRVSDVEKLAVDDYSICVYLWKKGDVVSLIK